MIAKINGKKALVGNLTREASESNLGQTLTFDSLELYKNGDIIKIYDDGELKFSGMVIKIGQNFLPPHSYKARDYSFNLQSEDHGQIKDRVDSAIKNMCKKFGIPCQICSIPTKIKKIFPDTPLSDMFREMLDMAEKEQDKEYFMEVDCGKLVIDEKSKIKVSADFLIDNQATLTRSIEELKNSVKIVSSDGVKVYGSAKDERSINEFGLLQVVESIDDDKKSKASVTAKNRLNKLNKETCSIPVRLYVKSGAWDIKVNRLIKVELPQETGWNKVRSLMHTVEDGNDFIDITLEWKE